VYKRQTLEDGRTKRPLTAVEDFHSNVLVPATQTGAYQPGLLSPYLKDTEALDGATETSQRMRYLALATETLQSLNKTFDATYKPKTGKSEDFLYRNPVQFFEVDGSIDENVKTAISVGALTWLQESASQRAFQSDDGIKALLNRPSSHIVTRAEQDLVGSMLSRDKTAINDLGRRAMQASGLKAVKNTPASEISRLESAMGSYALAMLASEGYVERVGVSGKALNIDGSSAVDATHWFVRIKRVPEAEGSTTMVHQPRVQTLVETGKGTGTVLNDLFGVENSVTGPLFTAPKRVQQTTKGTQQAIPSEQKAIIDNDQATKEWTVREDMKGLLDHPMFEGEGRDLLYRMAGATNKSYRVQKGREASLRGKNEGLVREVDQLFDFYEDPNFQSEEGATDYTKPFFFRLSVWVNQRVGIDSNTVNPLTSKVHRFAIGMPQWRHQVPVTGDDHKLTQFKLAVLEGLGKPVDKQSNAKSLDSFDTALAEDTVRASIETVKKMTTGQTVTEAEANALAEYVAGEEQFHTLDAIQHVARWELAGNEGTFESTLVREGDGITNGPALSMILSGAWGSLREGVALVNKMGFFEKGNPVQSAGTWLEDKSNKDLYETLADRIDTGARKAWKNGSPVQKAQYAGIFNILGSFRNDDNNGISPKGRKRVKTPLTGMVFGASTDKSIRNMGEDVVDLFYEHVEGILNKPYENEGLRKADLNAMIEAINPLLVKKLDPEMAMASAQSIEFTSTQRQQIVGRFVETVGQHVEVALDEQFKTFMDFRKQMNNMARLSYDLFEVTRDFETRKFLNELMTPDENGDVQLASVTKKKPIYKNGKVVRNEVVKDATGNPVLEPLQDLTPAQQKALDARIKDVSPLMHTVLSRASGELDAGMLMAKTGNGVSERTAYNTSISTKTGYP